MHREGGGRNQPAAKAGAGNSAFSVEESHLGRSQSQPPTEEKENCGRQRFFEPDATQP
jgi:hypothetical protein